MTDLTLEALEEIDLKAEAAALSDSAELGRGIYIASKTKHAARWVDLAKTMPVISTWIYEAEVGASSDLADLWFRCVNEAKSCKALVAYREPDEVFKGGWVEIGAAMACGVPVHAFGLEGFTISHATGIVHHDTLESALRAALSQPDRSDPTTTRALVAMAKRAVGDGWRTDWENAPDHEPVLLLLPDAWDMTSDLKTVGQRSASEDSWTFGPFGELCAAVGECGLLNEDEPESEDNPMEHIGPLAWAPIRFPAPPSPTKEPSR